jgi:hypothetical protein
MRRTLVAVACGVALLSSALAAHHATAVFDLGKRLTLTGTVTEWFWANRTLPSAIRREERQR